MLFGFSFFLKKRTFIDNIGFELIAPFVFIINSLLFVLLFGGIYQEPGPAFNLIKLAIPLVLIFSLFLVLSSGKKNNIQKLSFLAMIILAIVLRVMVLISSPSPRIDVFDMLKEGPRYLFSGENPYSQLYPQRYVGVIPDYFTYFPLTLLVFAPIDYLFSDPRVAFIISDLVTAFIIYKIIESLKSKAKSLKFILPLVFLYHPSGSFILEQSWIDGLIFAFLAGLIFLQIRVRAKDLYSYIILAFFLSLKQSLLILIPFFLIFTKLKKTVILRALLLIGVSILPFALWSFSDFYHDTIKFFLNYPARYDSITVNTFFYFLWGRDIPKIFLYFVWTVVGIFSLIWAASRIWSRFVLAVAFFLFTFFFFNKLAFIHYYFLISLLILLASILRFGEESKRH